MHEHHQMHGQKQHVDAAEMHVSQRPPPHPSKHAHSGAGHMGMIKDFRRRFWISFALTIPVLVLSPMLQHWAGLGNRLRFAGDQYILFGLSSLIYFYGGYPFLQGLVVELRRLRPAMMTLVAVAISTAYLYSSAVVFGLAGDVLFGELATLIDIMLLGHWIEMKSVMGASNALEELARLMPSNAHKLLPNGSTSEVLLNDLAIGDRVLVKPGEKIPADGDVREGASSVNEAMLTGESKPVNKVSGTKVIGGAINGEGSLVIEVRRTGKESFLSQVIDLVRQAQESKSRTQDLANRAAFGLTLIALGGGILTFIAWTVIVGQNLAFALERTVTVMVIACPHALGLAVPLVVAVSTALSARRGLLIRNRAAFERGRNIRTVIFDKTGTLTQGKFGVTDVIPFDREYARSEILKLAASVEAHSEHPIAKSIASSSPDTYPVDGFSAIPGKGAQGSVNGISTKVVSPGYLREQGISVPQESLRELWSQGKTIVFVLSNERPIAAIALADIVRPESKRAVTQLKEMGLGVYMLTGDSELVAKQVALETGLSGYFSEVLPENKAAKVKEMQARGGIVAMVGDGINDAPALAQADVGIAIGAGTDVAMEAADIVLVNSNPLDALAVLSLARSTYAKMVQNLLWATGYNIVAVPLAAGVLYELGILLTPAMGAVLMTLSTVIVSFNSRLLRLKR